MNLETPSKRQLGLWALGLVMAQVMVLLALTPPGTLAERYLSLNNWDSLHYERIAETGYRLPASGQATSDEIHQGLANVVFLPGYPLAASLASRATGLSVRWTLPLVAQLAAILFWFYFLLYLYSVGASRIRSATSVAVFALHPAAFYLCVGYTESLFLASMMGFLYWSDRMREKRSGAGLLAAAHGFLMSSTRIVAFGAAVYPFFRSVEREDLRRSVRAPLRFLILRWREILLGLAGISGAILFFTYCQVRFGQWDIYFKLEEIGWKNKRLWFAILNPLSYVPRFFFENSWDSLNRLAVTWTAAQLIQSARGEVRTQTQTQTHWKNWALWAVAFILFYIPLTGKANANLESMLRYTLPTTLLLLIVQAAQSPDRPVFNRHRKWAVLLAAVSFALQLWCAYRFLKGGWVA
jgi:hypothetical protein